VSDKDFDELFEKAPDWPTAVANLRGLIERETEAEASRFGSKASRLDLLKDTASETILAIMGDHSLSLRSTDHNRYTGGEIRYDAPSFLVWVLRKAFLCYRSERVPEEARAAAAEAKAAAEIASERKHRAYEALPPEMRERGY
jgi:hypothetical protein